MSENRWDFCIVGAGPGGSALAAYLAQAGFKVLLLEKELFPRFHIGESLLPLAVPILLELGLHLDDAPFALKKGGAQVFQETQNQWFRISFDDTLSGCFPHAYQVDRAPFDQALAEIAAKKGAVLQFGHRVADYEEQPDQVLVKGNFATLSCRYLIDASGQQALLAKKRRRRTWIRGLGKYASFTHFSNVKSPTAARVFKDGDILLLILPQKQWAWAIPLPGQRLSIGVVAHDGGPVISGEESFHSLLQPSPLLRELLAGAERVEPIRRCANFSFYNSEPTSARTLAFGDARAFLDPVFSTGVSLALYAAKLLSGALQPYRHGNEPLQLEAFHREIQWGYNVYERIVERFYRAGWVEHTFFLPNKSPQMVRQLNTILAGYVWREDNNWQNALTHSRKRRVRYQSEKYPRVSS